MPFALLSATLIAAAPVHLLENAPPAFAAQVPERALVDPDVATWYGWEPLLVDATAGVLFYGATAFAQQLQPTAQGVVTVASILLYAGGGPLLHLGRGRPLTALVDLGLRAGLPVAGLVVGVVAGPLSGVYGQLAYPGFVLGFVAAVITDLVGLSWDTPEESASLERTAPSWTPFVGNVRGAPVAGLAGRF